MYLSISLRSYQWQNWSFATNKQGFSYEKYVLKFYTKQAVSVLATSIGQSNCASFEFCSAKAHLACNRFPFFAR